jgi:tetratricopeptide (TPR) repeat protein
MQIRETPQNLKQAEEFFTHAIDLDPLNTNALIEMGSIHLLKGDSKGASEHFSKALEIDPHDE